MQFRMDRDAAALGGVRNVHVPSLPEPPITARSKDTTISPPSSPPKSTPSQKNLKYYQYFLCGGGAGFACDMVVHPLDTVRCRMQVILSPPNR